MTKIIFFLYLIIPYGNNPDWESYSGYYSTGGGFCDIDKDGDMDFIVSNGNDMQIEENVIYSNIGGSLSKTISWLSNDAEYSGHLSINDFNNDGFLDFAISNYLGQSGFNEPGNVVIYINLNGNPNSNPFWKSKDSTYNFSCDFGDIDGDGYSELAIAGGEIYTGKKEPIKIYKNNRGIMSDTPYFKSYFTYYAYDVLFYDINQDGWLDLIVACDSESNLIFMNNNGKLDSVPTWVSQDKEGSIQVDVGDIDENGYPDLVFANNGQLPPYSSNLKIYLNFTGIPRNIPDITLDSNKVYYSTVSLCDIDYDGDLDIAAGGWWEPLVIFENLSGSFNQNPDWEWQPSIYYDLVCEKITFTEIDNNWISSSDTFIRAVNHPVYTFKKRNLCEIESVIKIDSGINFTLPLSYYTYSLESGWISINKNITKDIDTFIINYKFPSSYDLSVTNWEESRGNFYFLSTYVGIRDIALQNSSSASNKTLLITQKDIPAGEIFDISGKRAKKLKGIGFLKVKQKVIKLILIK